MPSDLSKELKTAMINLQRGLKMAERPVILIITIKCLNINLIVAQVIGYFTSAERDNGERVSFSVEPMFPANLNQAPSSMYSALPTVLTKPHVANHRLDASPLNSIQPIIAGNQISINSERPNLLLGSSSHHGYFQDMQPEERSRNFARVSSRDTGHFNQNNMSSIVGNGLPVPFFQAVNSNFNIPAQFSLENSSSRKQQQERRSHKASRGKLLFLRTVYSQQLSQPF
ncbi:hypothetical protein OIU78_013771 [Salix suchowensis]|nr:hypothetical protein OIU78_013771 [Salix suchowensis]